MKEPIESRCICQKNGEQLQRSLGATYPAEDFHSSLEASIDQKALDALSERIRILEDENKHLVNTINWMHDTIWDLLRKNVINS